MGNKPNLHLKEKFFKEHIPYAKFIGVELSVYQDKSHIDMKDGVFIDDSESNLLTSNAKEKYVFGDIYPWNEKSRYPRLYNWVDILERLTYYTVKDLEHIQEENI